MNLTSKSTLRLKKDRNYLKRDNTRQPHSIAAFLSADGTLSGMCLVSDRITWSDKDFVGGFFPAAAFKTTFLRSLKQSCRHHSEAGSKAVHRYMKRQSSFSSPLMKMTGNDGLAGLQQQKCSLSAGSLLSHLHHQSQPAVRIKYERRGTFPSQISTRGVCFSCLVQRASM